jgi:glycosyltransferase involved in cell wall biosynthesis
LIGDGPERAALDSQVAALPRHASRTAAGDRIRFVGMLPDAGRLVRAFDVVCLPSRTEGTPMVLLEALAAGVPAVAFAVGGIPDVLHDVPEWLVPPGDVPALAARLTAVLSHLPGAAERAATAGARRAAQSTPEAWVAAHRRVYDAVMHR